MRLRVLLRPVRLFAGYLQERKTTQSLRVPDQVSSIVEDQREVKNDNATEIVKLEVNARLEEFKALRSEILTSLSSAYATTNLTVSAVGVLLAASPFIIKTQAYVVFLLASFLFYFSQWTQLRFELSVYNMSEHISLIVAPGVRNAWSRVQDGDQSMPPDVLSWEVAGRARNHAGDILYLPIESARYVLPLLVGAASALTCALSYPSLQGIEPRIKVGLVINAVTFAYSILMTILVRQRLRGPRNMKGLAVRLGAAP